MSEIRIEPWAEGDLPLLELIMGDPAMTEHLGGPEPADKIAERHGRYLNANPGTVEMFKIVDGGEAVGSVGYWERPEGDDKVYETGWSVLPEFQGRGFATKGTDLVIEHLRGGTGKRRFLYAYPSEDNHPSNAICRKLGFELVGTTEYEYPKNSGNIMRCNDWRLDLSSV